MKQIVLLVAFAFGCSSNPKTTDSTNPEDKFNKAPDDVKCSGNETCVAVETMCCDHCNGGKVLAFNTTHAEAHRPKGCEGTVCTQMACEPLTSVCSAVSKEANACIVVTADGSIPK